MRIEFGADIMRRHRHRHGCLAGESRHVVAPLCRRPPEVSNGKGGIVSGAGRATCSVDDQVVGDATCGQEVG